MFEDDLSSISDRAGYQLNDKALGVVYCVTMSSKGNPIFRLRDKMTRSEKLIQGNDV